MMFKGLACLDSGLISWFTSHGKLNSLQLSNIYSLYAYTSMAKCKMRGSDFHLHTDIWCYSLILWLIVQTCPLCHHSISGHYYSFNVNQVSPSSFVSLVLLHQYVEYTVVVHDAFKPNKGPWIFNHGAAVWLSALQTVVTHQYICHLIYPSSRIIEIYWHLDYFNYLPLGH